MGHARKSSKNTRWFKLLTLDVGCGDNPQGNVNIDHRMEENIELDPYRVRYVNVKAIPNFIRCDALHLPFQDKAFDKTFCFHVIEPVPDPYKLVTELKRVTKQSLEIRCPHRFSKHAKNPFHRHYFTRKWFERLFFSYKLHAKTSFWSPLGGYIGLIRLPHEIRVTVELDVKNWS